MSIKVVAFDLWGTLLSGAPTDIISEIAIKLGFNSATEFWNYCDKHYFHLDVSMREIFPKIIKERKLDVDIVDLTKSWENGWKLVSIYPDVIPLLEKIKTKFKIALVSNTGSDEGKKGLEILGLKKYFNEIVMSFEVGFSKPDPKIFKEVTERFSVKPNEVVYIGDHFYNDFLAAKNVGFGSFLIDRRGKYQQFQKEEWYLKSLEGFEKKLK